MESEEIENYRKSGAILKKAVAFAKKEAKPGAKLFDLAESIEKFIAEEGGKPAFPVNLSRNNEAAHATPALGDEAIFLETDVLKVDIGVHVEGSITDTAFTLNPSGEHAKLIEAAEKALENALSHVKAGQKISKIGAEIEKTIKHYGFSPVENLTGHGLSEFEAHAVPSIPNIERPDDRVLEDDSCIAIEPFATDGEGIVREGQSVEIFSLEEPKMMRNAVARRILEFCAENYQSLPFAERWIGKELQLSDFQRKTALRELVFKKCLQSYPVLREKEGKIVTQAETTILLADGKVEILV